MIFSAVYALTISPDQGRLKILAGVSPCSLWTHTQIHTDTHAHRATYRPGLIRVKRVNKSQIKYVLIM